MTTVRLTDAQFAQFTATGLIVVDGDAFECEHEHGRIHTHVIAPALWCKLTDPCPTCDGRGSVEADEWDMTDPDNHLGWVPCSDCAGGRQVVTLTATCLTYGETHIGNAMTFDKRGRKVPSGTGRCESDPPCERGVVTLGRFTIRLLPVVAGRSDERQWAVEFEQVPE